MMDTGLWTEDRYVTGFESRRLDFPEDYDGAVYATLLRRKNNETSKKAVLYIHGYMDYFFQLHLAEAYLQRGYNFYALDLRKYGRSLAAGQHPNYCQNIEEYFAEISEALRIMLEEDGNDHIVLNGHSTGGLIASLYVRQGQYRQHIKALVLNSPFFRLNVGRAFEAITMFLAWVSPVFPFIGLSSRDPIPYIQSIHKAHYGEWDFSLEWRKLNSFPIYSGWLRAIRNAHKRVHQGLDIQCPVLVLHSDKSIYGLKYEEKFQTGDAVLSVDHIRERSPLLGKNVQLVEIKDGLHDLILSRQAVREEALRQIFTWLEQEGK